MLIRIPNVLTPAQVEASRKMLETADWFDGKATAGPLTKSSKTNMQVPPGHPVARRLGEMITDALHKNLLFLRAALPLRIVPPSFNRYTGGPTHRQHGRATGPHVLRQAERVR